MKKKPDFFGKRSRRDALMKLLESLTSFSRPRSAPPATQIVSRLSHFSRHQKAMFMYVNECYLELFFPFAHLSSIVMQPNKFLTRRNLTARATQTNKKTIFIRNVAFREREKCSAPGNIFPHIFSRNGETFLRSSHFYVNNGSANAWQTREKGWLKMRWVGELPSFFTSRPSRQVGSGWAKMNRWRRGKASWKRFSSPRIFSSDFSDFSRLIYLDKLSNLILLPPLVALTFFL